MPYWCRQVHTNTPQVAIGIVEPRTPRLTARTLSYQTGFLLSTTNTQYEECHRTLFLHVFFVHFRPNFTSHSLPHTFLPYAYLDYACFFYAFMPSRSRTNNKNTIRLVQPDTEQLDYWATDILKQSCCGLSSPRSCAGTSSATTKRSHHSKFWTSQTQSTSRSASIARILLVIDRFLASTAARSARLTAAIRRAASLPTGTGKVVAPSTRFTATSSYRVFVRMVHLLDKMFRRNTALASTHGKRNDPREDGSRNRKWRNVLGRRKIVHQQVFLGFFQERLNPSLQFFRTKSRVVLRIGIPRSWRTTWSWQRRRTTPGTWRSRIRLSRRSIGCVLKTLLLLLRLLDYLLPRRKVRTR